MGKASRRRREQNGRSAGPPLTYADYHDLARNLADKMGEWAGISAPIEGFALKVEDRYPYKGIETIYAAPAEPGTRTVKVRNRWYSTSKRCYITLYDRDDGGVGCYVEPKYRATDRVTYLMGTMGASQAWDLNAEHKALEKLCTLIPPHLAEMYLLTGTFMETSPRSGVTYILRRCRPTIAMVPSDRHDDTQPMKLLASLCMHPIAFYERTYCGAMVPTDDVVAHLLFIRGDEAGYWRRCNQHHAESPEAGI